MRSEEFRIRSRFGRKKVVAILSAFYLVAVPVYLYFGFQTNQMDVSAYAQEVAEATGILEIPSISLVAPISDVELSGRKLVAPNYIVGRYGFYKNKTLILGHSSTIFQGLERAKVGDEIVYDGKRFEIVSMEVKAKSEILMSEILKDEKEPTLVLMTCSGEHISGQDYSHRLIVNAVVRGE